MLKNNCRYFYEISFKASSNLKHEKAQDMIDNMTRIFVIDPKKPDHCIIEEIAQVILKGGLVAYPTDTVYGLGANIFNQTAVLRVFKVKNRPLDNPLPVLLDDMNRVDDLVLEFPIEAEILMKKFWPGPLTIILKKSRKIPNIVTGGKHKVGLRVPAHNVAINLIKLSDVPLTGPSANISGEVSPLTADDVKKELFGKIEVIIDSGPAYLGIESTVVDLTVHPPLVIREGMITIEELEKILRHPVKSLLEPPKKSVNAKAILIGRNSETAKIIESLLKDEIKKQRRVLIAAFNEDLEKISTKSAKVIKIGSLSDPFSLARNIYRILRFTKSENINSLLITASGYKKVDRVVLKKLEKFCREVVCQ